MQLRPVLLATGIMTALVGAAMIPSALIDIADGREAWGVFAISAFGTIFIGMCLALLVGQDDSKTGPREAFFLTVLIWVMLPAVAAIPFVFAGETLTDAMFESVSGLTTTGATILTGLDGMPRGLLLWRAILQWIGGIGIIVTAIAILPSLRVGGMQLFQIESSDVSGKFLPRVTEIAAQTGIVYLVLSVACAVLYSINGMNTFDSVTHAMTTMSAGGYSTHDASLGFFGNGVASVAILFMILAGLPFASFVMLARGNPRPLLKSSQPRVYLAIMSAAIVLLLIHNSVGNGAAVFEDNGEAIRTTAFSVVSVMTGTGYANANYAAWGPGATSIFLVLMFLGGCAGSAACGLKVFRLEIAVRAIIAHAQRMTSPHRLVPVRYNSKSVDEDTIQSVLVFVFLYLATFVITAALLGLTGLDPVTAISGAATSVSNVGPGLGSVIGPAGTFQSLPDMAKWICAGAMLLGRLEFVAVFVVLTPRFWRG
ncbi:MAG: TrkH family potassium uptake protein [Hyphomonadaceae bacterium]